MKKIYYLSFLLLLIVSASNAQGLNGLIKKATGNTDSTKATNVGTLIGKISGGSSLNNGDIAAGLKEALNNGVQKGTQQLAATDGFLGNAAVKILMPQEAKQVEQKLRALGMGNKVDEAITSMNRAAEDAAKSAAPIFVQAVKDMSINDALSILKGTDTAATGYLRNATTQSLTNAFKPVIETSLQKVNATSYWNSVFSAYNQIPFVKKVNTDLTAYVTQKALDGIFLQISLEEKNIRQNPAARVSDILKKVFGN